MEENRQTLSDLNIFFFDLNIFNQQNSVMDVIHWVREGQRDKDKMFGVGHVKFQDGGESR